jgi:hypothetical protein
MGNQPGKVNATRLRTPKPRLVLPTRPRRGKRTLPLARWTRKLKPSQIAVTPAAQELQLAYEVSWLIRFHLLLHRAPSGCASWALP